MHRLEGSDSGLSTGEGKKDKIEEEKSPAPGRIGTLYLLITPPDSNAVIPWPKVSKN